jgi:hypothetical protein
MIIHRCPACKVSWEDGQPEKHLMTCTAKDTVTSHGYHRKPTPIEDLLASLRKREEAAWGMASMFLENRDAHGVMDAGSELESLRRAISEIEKLENAMKALER